jgi:hypothetical protein
MPGEGGSYDSHFTSGRSATAVSTAGPAGDDLDDRQDPVRRSAKDRVTKLEFAGLRFLSLTRQWNQDGDFLPDPTEGI